MLNNDGHVKLLVRSSIRPFVCLSVSYGLLVIVNVLFVLFIYNYSKFAAVDVTA